MLQVTAAMVIKWTGIWPRDVRVCVCRWYVFERTLQLMTNWRSHTCSTY